MTGQPNQPYAIQLMGHRAFVVAATCGSNHRFEWAAGTLLLPSTNLRRSIPRAGNVSTLRSEGRLLSERLLTRGDRISTL
jgi:hypothetical protein